MVQCPARGGWSAVVRCPPDLLLQISIAREVFIVLLSRASGLRRGARAFDKQPQFAGLIAHYHPLCPATLGPLNLFRCSCTSGALSQRDRWEIHMRDAFAATVVAAALVFVPAQARLEPMASTIAQFDSDVIEVSATAEVQTNNPANTVLETSEPEPGDPLLGAKDRDEGNETNGTAASVSPESGAPAGASADAICATLGRSAAQNSLPLDFFIRLIWQKSR